MRKKIIIILSVISLFIILFSISSIAFDENDYGKPYLQNGDIITFNDNIVSNSFIAYDFLCHNNYNSGQLYGISFSNNNQLSYLTYNSSILAYTNNAWYNNDFKVMTVNQDYVMTEEQATRLANNSNYVIKRVPTPPPPSPMENAYEYSNNFLSSTFNSIGQITNFISNNAAVCICTVGILIVSFVVGLLHRIRKRTFKSR